MYLFFLGAVPLPITPGALTIKTPSLNKTVSLVNDGEINIPKTSGLREISFEFLLPQIQKYPFANYNLGTYTASVMIPLLNAWKNTMLPFRFIVVRTTPKGMPLYFTYIKCVIEDFEYNEDAEAHGMDVMCSINLKEYKDYGTKSIKISEVKNSNGTVTKTASTKTSRPSTKTTPSKITTTKDTTWPNVAKETTGSFDGWEDIAYANGVDVPDVSGEISDHVTVSLISDGIIDNKRALSYLETMVAGERMLHEAIPPVQSTDDPYAFMHPTSVESIPSGTSVIVKEITRPISALKGGLMEMTDRLGGFFW